MDAETASSRLALDGGAPVRTTPFPSWPVFGADEIEAVSAVLRSGKVNYWTGTEGRAFEKEFAEFSGCPHGVAVANGTVALELALQALGIGPGDDVVVPSRTFIATASSVVACGARPVVADIDPDSGNVTAETLRAAQTDATKAVIPVHLGGWPCDMDPILALAKERGLMVVEDCAQAIGATYKGKPVGSFGNAAAFSFCQDKILTTAGEGGMITTQDRGVWERSWSRKDHGKNSRLASQRVEGNRFQFVHDTWGTNARMTEVQSAQGRIALRKVPGWIQTRRSHANTLNDRLSRLPGVRVSRPSSEFGHVYYKYYAFLDPEALKSGWDRWRILDALVAEGIPGSSGICGQIYQEKAFAEESRPAAQLPGARALGDASLMFPVHPTLSNADVNDICSAIEKVLRAAVR